MKFPSIAEIRVAEQIDKNRYHVFKVIIRGGDWKVTDTELGNGDINKADFTAVFENLQIVKFDMAFIVIHGTPGENGLLQGYLETIKIPYNTCDVFTSALTFNKFACLTYVGKTVEDLFLAKSILVHKKNPEDAKTIAAQVGLPCFVKPNNSGSSCGVSKAKSLEDIETALVHAFAADDEVLIEEFIDGMELTNGVFKTAEQELIFPITEVISKNEFFDYEAKYNADKSIEITPARISQELENQCKQLSSKIYDTLHCRGIVRVDYILKENKFYFLEINTVPGQTKTSFIPQQIRAMGKSPEEIYSLVIEDSLAR